MFTINRPQIEDRAAKGTSEAVAHESVLVAEREKHGGSLLRYSAIKYLETIRGDIERALIWLSQHGTFDEVRLTFASDTAPEAMNILRSTLNDANYFVNDRSTLGFVGLVVRKVPHAREVPELFSLELFFAPYEAMTKITSSYEITKPAE